MKEIRWLFIVVALSLLAFSSFAEIARPISRMPMISINVVCLYNGFPTKANVSVEQIVEAENVIPIPGLPSKHAPNGFASFNVRKGLSYKVSAYKAESAGISKILGTPEDSRRITDVNSSVVIGLVLTESGMPGEMERVIERERTK